MKIWIQDRRNNKESGFKFDRWLHFFYAANFRIIKKRFSQMKIAFIQI
jgi:hypothetical protein